MPTSAPDPITMSGQSDVPVRTDTQSLPKCWRWSGLPGVILIGIPVKKPNGGRPYYHENCELISATLDDETVPLHVLFPEGSFKGTLHYDGDDGSLVWAFYLIIGLRIKTSSDDGARLREEIHSSVCKAFHLTFRHRFTQHFDRKSKPTSILEAMVYEDEEVLDEQLTVIKFDQMMLS